MKLLDIFALSPEKSNTSKLRSAALSEIKAYPSSLRDYREASQHHKSTIFFYSPQTLQQAHFKVALYAAVSARLTGNSSLNQLAKKALRIGDQTSSWKDNASEIASVISKGGRSIGKRVRYSPEQKNKLRFVEGAFGSWTAKDVKEGQAIAQQAQWTPARLVKAQRAAFQGGEDYVASQKKEAQWYLLRNYVLIPSAGLLTLYVGYKLLKRKKDE